MATNINFVIQSMEIKTGSNTFFKSIKDKEGFYSLPGFVFDEPSRNKKIYDTNSMIDCVSNPATRFYRMLTEGNLRGEWGHPITKDFDRLTKIDEKSYALWIGKIWVGELKTGEKVIWVKFKTCGPYGKCFEEALEDPHMNSSLSIRVACVDGPMQAGGNQLLYPKCMVTFDAVGGGGYMQACKRIAMDNKTDILGMEDYSLHFTENDLTESVGNNLIHMENYNKESVLEYFKADSIIKKKEIIKVDMKAIQSVNFHNSFVM